MADSGGQGKNFDFSQFLSNMKMQREEAGGAPGQAPPLPSGNTGKLVTPDLSLSPQTGKLGPMSQPTQRSTPPAPQPNPQQQSKNIPLGPNLKAMPVMQSPPDVGYEPIMTQPPPPPAWTNSPIAPPPPLLGGGTNQRNAPPLTGAPPPLMGSAPAAPKPLPLPEAPMHPAAPTAWEAAPPLPAWETPSPEPAWPAQPEWQNEASPEAWAPENQTIPGWDDQTPSWPASTPPPSWNEATQAWGDPAAQPLPDWNGDMPSQHWAPEGAAQEPPQWGPEASTAADASWAAEAPAWDAPAPAPSWETPAAPTAPVWASTPAPPAAPQAAAPAWSPPPPAPALPSAPPPTAAIAPPPMAPALPASPAAPAPVQEETSAPADLRLGARTRFNEDVLNLLVRPNLSMRLLLDHLVELGASDLHLSAGVPPCLRLKGDIQSTGVDALTQDELERMLMPILNPSQTKTFTELNDIDFAIEVNNLARFRCNFSRQYRGIACVMRIIPKDIPRLDQLNLPAVIGKIAKTRRGLVIVTGPTGSGKSTTLAAMLREINMTRQAHIITIEDPIEFVHQSDKSLITHREVGTHATSFADAIRAAVREDPDIILVGEMRDLDTVSQAVRAAEMGMLVLATLHTNNASKAVDRIIDIFPAEDQEQIRITLSEGLKAVVAQQLLKRQDGQGRIAVHEVLIGSPALSNLIREAKTHQIPSVIQTGRDVGMQLMDQGLIDLIQKGLISPEQAREKATDLRNFQRAGIHLE